MFEAVVKTLASHIVPGFTVRLWFPTPASCYCRPWEAVLMTQATELLSSTWEA